jgi:hypothetical protein
VHVPTARVPTGATAHPASTADATMIIVNQATGRQMRVGSYGRVTYDDRTASEEIDRQYERCKRVLPPGAIVAVSYDIGPACSPSRRLPGPHRSGLSLRRDGGIGELLTESRDATRRFNSVAASDPFRLSRDVNQRRTLLERLRKDGVNVFFADLGIHASDWPDPILHPTDPVAPARWRARGGHGGRR